MLPCSISLSLLLETLSLQIYTTYVQSKCINSLLCSSSPSSATHFNVLLSHSSVCMALFPPSLSLSLCNKAEIPSGVRRDSRGNSAQWGVEALSSWLPQCAQPCRTLQQETEWQWEKSQSASRPNQRAFSLADWQMGKDAQSFHRVLFSDCSTCLSSSSELTPRCRSLSAVV